jgi:hypothetical protein
MTNCKVVGFNGKYHNIKWKFIDIRIAIETALLRNWNMQHTNFVWFMSVHCININKSLQ